MNHAPVYRATPPRAGRPLPATSELTSAARRPPLAWSWKVGELFGIGIYVHATLFALLAWYAATGFARAGNVGGAATEVAFVAAVLGTIVLHELGHALAARRFGIATRDITLLPIGGVAALERIPEVPAQELVIALAGPAVNVVLAVALGAVVYVTGGALGTSLVAVAGAQMLVKLVWVNVSLAVFNLLPAFPMDGGRVLRAALALRLDYARATELAATIAKVLAVGLAAAGAFANPMLILIAFFVWTGASSEASLVRFKSALAGLRVERAMITTFAALSPSDPIADAARLVVGGFQHVFPVVEDGHVVGILTRADVVKGLADGGAALPVDRVMQREVVTAQPGELIQAVLERMQRSGTEPVAIVLRDDRVVGLISAENIGELVMFDAASHRGGA